MPTKLTSIRVFECRLDLRQTGGALTIVAGNKPSELSPPRYEVRPNQTDNTDYVYVLRQIADALENNQDKVSLTVEGDHFIVKSPTLNAAAAPSPRILTESAPPKKKSPRRKTKASKGEKKGRK
jgi:hypothetical protein